MVGTTPGAVRRLDHIYTHAPDVFRAVRERRIEVLRDARDIAEHLHEPEARTEALRLRAKHPKLPIARLVADVLRARRPELPPSPRTPLRGDGWSLHVGPMAEQSRAIPDGSIDLVHADIVYGSVPMATEVAHVAARVLARGGVLALISGNVECFEIQTAVAAQGLTLVTIAALYLPGSTLARPGRIQRIDSVPVFLFGKDCGKGEKLARPIDHVGFVSENREQALHRWEKHLGATLDLVSSLVDPGGRVLDPCCGSGTTGEAAHRHGCTFVGIDIDPDAIKVAAARLARVERELADAGGDAPPKLVKARRKRTGTR